MQGLQKYYQVLQNGLLFLDEDELQALDVAVYACLANYTYLAHSAMTSGLVRYNVVHKHHMFAHIPAVARATGINPRAVDTYTEESFISQGISCATNCLIGPGPASFGLCFGGDSASGHKPDVIAHSRGSNLESQRISASRTASSIDEVASSLAAQIIKIR